jgi:hypothetical protein
MLLRVKYSFFGQQNNPANDTLCFIEVNKKVRKRRLISRSTCWQGRPFNEAFIRTKACDFK